jgi:ABC-type dipeptide/oligopeptide/nickel transport system ATPase component
MNKKKVKMSQSDIETKKLRELITNLLNSEDNNRLSYFKNLVWNAIKIKEKRSEDILSESRWDIEKLHYLIFKTLIDFLPENNDDRRLNLIEQEYSIKDFSRTRWKQFLRNPNWNYYLNYLDYYHNDYFYSLIIRKIIFPELKINETYIVKITRNYYSIISDDKHANEKVTQFDNNQNEYIKIFRMVFYLLILTEIILDTKDQYDQEIFLQKIKDFSFLTRFPYLDSLDNNQFLDFFFDLIFKNRKMRNILFSYEIFNNDDIQHHSVLQNYYPLIFLNNYEIQTVLSAQFVEEFRVDGPHIIDFEKGNWIYIPEIIENIKKKINENNSVLIKGVSGSGKSIIGRYIGYSFVKSKTVYYFDFLDVKQDQIDKILEYLLRMKENMKSQKLLFIFDNIHIIDQNSKKQLSKIKENYLSILIERTLTEKEDKLKKEEENYRINDFEIKYSKENIFLPQESFKKIKMGIIRNHIKDEEIIKEMNKYPIIDLWYLAFILRIYTKDRLEGKKSEISKLIIDKEKRADELILYLQNLLRKERANLKFKESQMGSILEHLKLFLIIISIFSEQEFWINRSFIDSLLKTKFGTIYDLKQKINFKENILDQIIEFLVSINQIKYRSKKDPEGIINDEYRIPHRQLAQLYKDLLFNKTTNWVEFLNQIYLEAPIEFPPQKIIEDTYDSGDGGFIDPGRYHTTSVNCPLYGVYLRKAFKFEYLKNKKENNYDELKRILTLFHTYYKERPVIQRRFYMTNEGDIPFIPEPEINHNSPNYFGILVQLFKIDNSSTENQDKIDKNGILNEYFIPENDYFSEKLLNLDKGIKKYWKTLEIEKTLKILINTNNPYLFPWLNDFLLKLSNDINPKFEIDNFFTLLLNQNDKNVEKSIFDIIIRQNYQICIERFSKIISLRNSDIITQFLKFFIKSINFIVKDEDFSKIMELIQFKFTLHSDEIFILGKLMICNLNYKQIESLYNINIHLEENSKEALELKFALNIIFLLNRYFEQKKKKKNDNLKKSSISYEFMTEYATKSGNLFYFDLLNVLKIPPSLIFNQFDYSKYLKLDAIKFKDRESEVLYQTNDDPFERAVQCLVGIKNPTHIESTKALELYHSIEDKIKVNVISNKKNLDSESLLKKLENTFLYIQEHNVELKSEANSLIDELLDEFYEQKGKETLADEIFNMLWSKKNIQYEGKVKTMGVDIPYNLIHWTGIFEKFFNEFTSIDINLRLKWLKKLIPSDIDYFTYKPLFHGIKSTNLEEIVPMIWKKEFDSKNPVFYRIFRYSFRSGDFFDCDYEVGTEDIEKIPRNLIKYLPFEDLHQKLKEFLKFDEIKILFDNNFALNPKYRLKYYKDSENWKYYYNSDNFNKDIKDLTKIPRPFINVLYNYAENLVKVIPSKEVPLIFTQLWDEYWYYPLVHYRHHPSYIMYIHFSQDLASRIYPLLKDAHGKIAFLLCYIQKFGVLGKGPYNYFLDRDISEHFIVPLEELPKISPKLISKTMIMLSETDWFYEKESWWSNRKKKNHHLKYDLLYYYANLGEIPIEWIFKFLDKNTLAKLGLIYIDIEKIFPKFIGINKKILYRVNLFQNLLRIPKESRNKVPKDLIANSEEDYLDSIKKIKDLINNDNVNIPILDVKKINSSFDSLWDDFSHIVLEIENIYDLSEFERFISEIMKNPLNYFLPDGFSFPLPKGIYIKKNYEESEKLENEPNDEDEKEGYWNTKDLWSFGKEFCIFIFNMKDGTLNPNDFLEELQNLNNKKKTDYILNQLVIGGELEFPMKYIYEFLQYLLNLLLNNPDKQKYEIKDLGLELNYALYKECSVEVSLLDNILSFGFNNNCLISWYDQISAKYGEDSKILNLFTHFFLYQIHFFEDIKKFPKILRNFGLKLLIFKFFSPKSLKALI